jgi:hypothetical protein
MFFWLSKEMDGFDFCWGKNWMDVVKFGASRTFIDGFIQNRLEM